MQQGYPHAFRFNEFAAIAAGGAVGALMRHVGELLLPGTLQVFPWITFIENLSGSFLIGFTAAFFMNRWPNPLLSPFLLVGVFGSYTTFATFAAGFWERIDIEQYVLAWSYAASTFVLGLIAVWLGHVWGKKAGSAR